MSEPDAADPRLELLLALGDDELVTGHRHSHWTGVAPHLEEDLAFSSIAQDEIGHAAVFYELAADHFPDAVAARAVHADRRDDPLDALGLGRPPHGYRHAVLCERPPGDWAFTLARQHVYDTVDDVRLASLARSAWPPLAEAIAPLRREERYHLAHARAWVPRLARAGGEARQRLEAAMGAVLAEAGGLVEPLAGEDVLVAEGVVPEGHAVLGERAAQRLADELGSVGLAHLVTAPLHGGLGGRHGIHTEDFTALWEELTGTYRAHPGVRW